MEEKIIAFDLGSNSIGAAIRNPFEEEQFEKAIVITFETGVGKDTTSGQFTVSLAANRTSKRSVRRLYQSRKYKLWTLLEALIQDKNNLYCPIKPESLQRWKYYNKSEAQNGNGGRRYPVDDVAFNNWIKLDFNNDSKPDYISPYQLRHELATTKLDFSIEENRFKLGRTLYHISQHRGFKSSKIVKNKDDEKENKNNEQTTDAAIETAIGAERKKQERFYTEVSELGFTINQEEDTIGSIFALIENEGINHSKRKVDGIRIRKELHQFVTRKMLIKEVKKIFEFQGLDFGAIFNDKKGNTCSYQNSTIFRQRPLRSQKGLVGICTLENKLWEVKDTKGNIHLKEVGKKRCPVSRPEFEEFRALCLINNIATKRKSDKNSEWEFLSEDKRNDLFYGKFFVQKDFTFENIYKYKPLVQWLDQKYGKGNWDLNYNYKTNVPACSVSTRLQKLLGEKWNELIPKIGKTGNPINIIHADKNGTINNEYPLMQPCFEDVWHVLFESNDEDFIYEYAQKHNLNEKELVNLWYAMPVGYAQLSLKAINNILPFLHEGYIYTDAVLLAKVPEILGDQLWAENKDMITAALKDEVIAKNRSEKRILHIVNTLIARFKSSKKKELKDYIIGSLDHLLPKGSKERDSSQILTAIEEGIGKETWKQIPDAEKEQIKTEVTQGYQAFFNSAERKFYSLPRLADAMKRFLADTFPDLLYCKNTFNKETKCQCEKCKCLNKLYHPSILDIYPKARNEYYKHGDLEKRMILLGSPKIGSWKNPMALRTLHELKKLINYLIATGEIDEETRVIVEVGRELVDTNKRWAYEKYKQMREEENKEFAKAIRELVDRENINANPDSDSDLDKFRLWYEMIDSQEGYEDKRKKFISVEEDRTFGEVKKKKKGKKKAEAVNEEGEEERYYSFNKNQFDKIEKEVWLKLKKAKDNVEERYRLWKEQKYFCIYTGKPIMVSDLFDPNLIDVEHTIPRSNSFDNSLANKTVCYADFNRNIKKNKIPSKLDNFADIKLRIGRWEQKVKDLEVRVEFWKGKSKHASTKDYKDSCARQKHLWQFELDYWRNKVERFTIKEVKTGFKNSQLKDMQLISKYAFHYLKSYFNRVDVQKGEVTAQFRKIFDIQKTDTSKDRSKHSHHAKDAMVLSLIPVAAIRDKMLELWYKIEEKEKLLMSNSKNKSVIEEELRQLKEELEQLKFQCNLPKGFNNTIKRLDETLLINNIARNRSLLPASKKIKVNGKSKTATGDAIRGQLHKDSFFGAIKLVKKDEKGNWIKSEKGEFEFEPIKYVIREELVYKPNDKSPGFKNLKDLENKIVDKDLFKIIKKQVEDVGDFKEALKRGIWMLDKKGNRVNKMRRVRIVLREKKPVEVKSQTNLKTIPSKILPDRTHKQFYYATNGKNIAYALFEDKKGKKGFEMLSLFDAAKTRKTVGIVDLIDFFPKSKTIGNAKREGKLISVLQPNQKVIFYKESISELTELSQEELSKRLYRIISLYGKTTGQVQFQHHLEARPGKELSVGVSKVNFEKIEPRYLLSPSSFNMAIEGKHFEIETDGAIKWIEKDQILNRLGTLNSQISPNNTGDEQKNKASETEAVYQKSTLKKFDSFDEMNEADAAEKAALSPADHLKNTTERIKMIYVDELKKPMDKKIKFRK